MKTDMKPSHITLSVDLVERIRNLLRALDLFCEMDAAGLLGAEIHRQIYAEVKHPAPAATAPEIEEPEPCPDSLGDEDRRNWEKHNEGLDTEDQIPQGEWIEYTIARADAEIDNR